jgi:hypothetical protein
MFVTCSRAFIGIFLEQTYLSETKNDDQKVINYNDVPVYKSAKAHVIANKN